MTSATRNGHSYTNGHDSLNQTSNNEAVELHAIEGIRNNVAIDVANASDDKANPLLNEMNSRSSRLSITNTNLLPITLTYHGISKIIVVPKKLKLFRKANDDVAPTSKCILDNVSGYAVPGKLSCIMGSSGAGKTTLLNILSGRDAAYTGSVKLNGRLTSAVFQRNSVFIQQTDLFFKVMTVREHLTFQAKLRMKASEQDRIARVNALITELGLTKIENNIIGDVGQGGISGGERRRLSFASEILNNPSLIFLDEPTSGLDSFMAEEIVQILKQLAQGGRTIVCTIHQPSSDIFNMFDTVMFMAHGKIAYSGDVKDVLPYFRNIDYHCPEYTNPADFIIKQLSLIPSDIEKSKIQIDSIVKSYSTSTFESEILKECERLRDESSLIPLPKTNNSVFAVGYLTQFTALLWRSSISITRDPLLTKARAMQSIILSVIVGLIYLQLGDNQNDVQNKMGALFFILTNQSFGTMFGVVGTFPMELTIFKREFKASMYASHVYFIARTTVEIPFQCFWTFLFTTIAYWMMNLRNDGTVYIEFTLVVILTANCALSFGYVISTLAPTTQVAMAISAPILLPLMLFGGLFINTSSIPPYFYWISYISFFKYAYEVLGVLIWNGVDLTCSVVTGTLNGQNVCQASDLSTGSQVLARYNMDSSNVGTDVGVLFALAVGFRLVSYFFLWNRTRGF